jgi:hypothetical protein
MQIDKNLGLACFIIIIFAFIAGLYSYLGFKILNYKNQKPTENDICAAVCQTNPVIFCNSKYVVCEKNDEGIVYKIKK